MTDRDRAAGTNQSGPPNTKIVPSGSEAALEAVAAPRPPVTPRRSRRLSEPAAAQPAEQTHFVPAADEMDIPIAPKVRKARTGITVETALYLAILAAAIVTRFWDLGAKALHHDESLHAYYSWVLETGGGYRHHPLMHGPFLFHANALVYLLFGDSDASSRYMPALFGVVLVGLPFLLRSSNLFGRWGALGSSFLLLISPVLLYQSRYIRHDIYTVTGTLLLFIAIVRYWEVPQRRWLVIGAATIAFLLTNHEIVFAIIAVFGGYLYGALLVGRIRAWWSERRGLVAALVGAHVGLVVALLSVLALMPSRYMDEVLDIPWDNPTTDQQMDYYRQDLTNPLMLAIVAILVVFLVALWLIFRAGRNPERLEEGRLAAIFGDPEPRTVEAAVRNAWNDRHGLTIAVLVGLFIFVTFFTTIYTNLYGLVSSTIATDGTLLYWLGQHDYRRGEQPWFYFLVLMPQYEFIAVALGGLMATYVSICALRALFGRSGGKNLFIRLMVTVWFFGIFAGLSYAGEKMPWLLSHITLPATLLAGVLIGAIIERVLSTRPAREDADQTYSALIWWPEVAIGGALLIAAAAWFGLAGEFTYGKFVESEQPGGLTRTVTSYAADRWWWLAVPVIVALAIVAVATYTRGSRRTALTVLATAVIVLGVLQVNVGWRLSYRDADVPTEMMIYTQTSPDVTRVMDEISAMSYELTGGKGIEVWYDSGVSWPFQWYLRDFPNKRFFGSSITGPPGEAPILLVASDRDSQVAPYMSGYTAQEYVLRWWFPEELYRDFAIAPELPPHRSAWNDGDNPHGVFDIIGSAIDSVAGTMTMDGQARLYRMLVYRDIEQPLGSYRFKVYVRNDLLPLLNSIRY